MPGRSSCFYERKARPSPKRPPFVEPDATEAGDTFPPPLAPRLARRIGILPAPGRRGNAALLSRRTGTGCLVGCLEASCDADFAVSVPADAGAKGDWPGTLARPEEDLGGGIEPGVLRRTVVPWLRLARPSGITSPQSPLSVPKRSPASNPCKGCFVIAIAFVWIWVWVCDWIPGCSAVRP
jgi:hypothetical protein